MEEFINGHQCFECKHCVKISPSFRLLSESELAFLNDYRVEITFKKGEIIYKQGSPFTHIAIIYKGLGKIYMEGSIGRDLILGFTKKYDINGGVGIFIDQRHHSSLVAVTDCEACFIEINAFKTLLRKNWLFMESYLKEHSLRALHIYNQFVLLTQKNMEGRMAESILYLSEHIFENGVIHNISNLDLSELTAMTRESAIRVLKEFKEDKLIEVQNHSINILDNTALQNIALHG